MKPEKARKMKALVLVGLAILAACVAVFLHVALDVAGDISVLVVVALALFAAVSLWGEST